MNSNKLTIVCSVIAFTCFLAGFLLCFFFVTPLSVAEKVKVTQITTAGNFLSKVTNYAIDQRDAKCLDALNERDEEIKANPSSKNQAIDTWFEKREAALNICDEVCETIWRVYFEVRNEIEPTE